MRLFGVVLRKPTYADFTKTTSIALVFLAILSFVWKALGYFPKTCSLSGTRSSRKVRCRRTRVRGVLPAYVTGLKGELSKRKL
jgi:hypothetical protein